MSNFGGVLYDNTTYIMTESIGISQEFTLDPGSSGVGIIWDGAGFTINATKTSGWLGLFPVAINVWNLGIVSNYTTEVDAGWFFQNGVGGTATNCFSNGGIGNRGGGIFGRNSSGLATNCYSTGDKGMEGGGIFGSGCSGRATNCYSIGSIGDYGGGIFGSISSGTAENSYACGSLGTSSGEIFGTGSTVTTTILSSYTMNWSDASARVYLTGTPATSPGIGSVWDSTATDYRFSLNPVTACFFGEAPVLTPNGYCRIDSLRVGDEVTTPTGYADVITRIYKRSTPACPNDNPYIIPVGTYGAIEPLLISPRHRIAVKGYMVEACNIGLKQAAKKGILTYYNLGLEGRSIMIVAGVEVESYVTR